MNKKIVVLGLTMGVLLTGCTNQGKNDANKNSSGKNKSSLVSSKKSSSKKDNDAINESNLTLNQANNFLKAKVKPAFLPKELPAVKSGYLNLHGTTGKDIKNYTFNFSKQSKKPDNNLTEENLLVKYQEQKLTQAEIDSQINWIAPEKGLPHLDLGYNIKATTQGAAGSTYLNWNEGKWSITIRSSNQVTDSAQKAQALAKQLVAYFEKNALPAPNSKGSIKIEQESTDNQKIQIKFDHEQNLISLNGPDIFTVLNFATNLD